MPPEQWTFDGDIQIQGRSIDRIQTLPTPGGQLTASQARAGWVAETPTQYLLRRNGQDMELTPPGVRLRPMVAEVLVSVQGVFEAHRAFDPATSTRRFVVAASDYGIGVVGARWSAHVGRRAPSVRIAFRTVAAAELSPWEVRSRDVDGILAPHGLFPEEMPHLDVVVDRWVIVADHSS